MIFKTRKILGIDITISPINNILEEIRKYLMSGVRCQVSGVSEKTKPLLIFTPNPEIITYAQKDNKFKEIVNTAQINIPDGSGVVWAIKKLFGLKIEKITGIDFMLRLVETAQKESLRIGLIGGKVDLADRTAECLRSQYKRLKIEVFEAPEIEIQNAKLKIKNYNVEESEDRYFKSLAEAIIEKKVDILFVALGFPKQEYFISHLSFVISHLSESRLVLMAVGGAFDYISDRIPRAPVWMRQNGLEWLFRLIKEPWRLPRQIIGAEFFIKILLGRLNLV